MAIGKLATRRRNGILTRIEWVRNADKSQGKTWNPITGCSAVSEGCRNCYARRMARRLAGRHGYPEYPHHFDVTLRPDRLDEPLRRKKPTTYFVCSMSDLFHPGIPPWFVCEVWQVMRECPQHLFQILTKRPKRMLRLIKTYIADHEFGIEPLPNVYLGVSCENQATADERIPLLLRTPAAVRFVSVEPMLAAIDIRAYLPGTEGRGEYCCGLDWVIVGGESGPGARPMHPDWARSLRDQCQEAGVPYFYKQHGAWLHESQFLEPVTIHTPGIVTFEEWNPPKYQWPDGTQSYRVGKKAAGRLLNGCEWNEMPEV